MYNFDTLAHHGFLKNYVDAICVKWYAQGYQPNQVCFKNSTKASPVVQQYMPYRMIGLFAKVIQ
jgi:hypothetical protein